MDFKLRQRRKRLDRQFARARRRVIFAQERDEFVSQQLLAREALALFAEGADRQVDGSPIEHIRDVERAARAKIQGHMRCNLDDLCDHSAHQDHRRVIVDRNAKRLRCGGRLELGRFKRLLKSSRAARTGPASCSARGVGIIPLGLRTNNSSLSM